MQTYVQRLIPLSLFCLTLGSLNVANGQFLDDTHCAGRAAQSPAVENWTHLADVAIRQYREETKSVGEILAYFSCYRKTEKGLKPYEEDLTGKYLDLYHSQVLVGTRVFNVPRALNACLLFRESQMDREAESWSGAKGLAQLLPPAIEQINKELKKKDVKEQWEKYFLTVRDVPKPWSEEKRKDYVPQEISMQDAANSEVAVGASNLYLSYLMGQVDKYLQRHAPRLEVSILEYSALLAVAYNRGEGVVRRMLKEHFSESQELPDEWYLNAGLDEEGQRHAESQINCMSKDKAFAPPKGTHRRACYTFPYEK